MFVLLISVGSVASGSASRHGSVRSRRVNHQTWQGPSCINALYQLLIAPFDSYLNANLNSGPSSPFNIFRKTIFVTFFTSKILNLKDFTLFSCTIQNLKKSQTKFYHKGKKFLKGTELIEKEEEEKENRY